MIHHLNLADIDIGSGPPAGPAPAGRLAGVALWLAMAFIVIAIGTAFLLLRTGMAVDALHSAAPVTAELAGLHAGITDAQGATRDLLVWLLAAGLIVLASGIAIVLHLWKRAPQSPVAEVSAQTTPTMDRRLAATIETLAQGVLILDPSYRLVACNRLLREFYPHAHTTLVVGTTLADMIACNVAQGLYPGHTAAELLDAMLRRFATGAPFAYRHDLPDGRAVTVRWQKLDDGGWAGTFEDITEHNRSQARIAHMSRHDRLSDLVNRAGFEEAVGRALARARRGEGFAVLAIALNRFKPVIDALGYAAGDTLLVAVAQRLRRAVREVDTVARLVGDEFAILQADIGPPESAGTLVQRIAEILTAPYQIDGHEIVIGVSIGIALGDAQTGDTEEVVRNATLALHRARQDNSRLAGTCIHRFFEPEMEARALARRVIEADLRNALGNGQFELFYQPLVNLTERRVCAFEALLRWRHPTRGLIPPDAFIPLAEDNGLIVPIGEWVLRTACVEAMRWQAQDGGAALRVAVNLSAIQFRSPGLLDAVKAALAESGLPAHRLELEITESVLLQDNDLNLQILHQFRALGARIAMDDFGTGYSSLGYLRNFPFDKLKIDRSFIHGLTDNSRNPSADADAIVRAIAGLGQALGISTTAEGVETQAQLERMIAVGCTEVQGYFFSPPRPASDVPALILTPFARQAA